jgi:hypothetical protein
MDSWWLGSGPVVAGLFYLLKDVIFGGRSLGKRFTGCYVVEVNSLQPCPLWKHPPRILLTSLFFPVEVFLRVGLLALSIFVRDLYGVFRSASFEWGARVMGLFFLARRELS